MRPATLAEVVGQGHLLDEGNPLARMIAGGRLSSIILWGPPGCGKTTIARLLADSSDLYFEPLSAVFSGVADLRRVFADAKKRRETGTGTLLFVDEIHRFNRAQQDGFLPYVEDGTVILVGATTENPSFELNSALLSRSQVMVLNPLSDDALETLIGRAEAEIGHRLPLDEAARASLKAMADGDGRFLVNLVEVLSDLPETPELGTDELARLVQKRAPRYDKDGDSHFNLISAVHKSLRASDTDAALYWTARMLDAGEDPAYLLRRLTRFAVEDVGLADPDALRHAIAAWEAYDRLGSPEGELAITNLVIYLGTAPKSNAAYAAHKAARAAAGKTGSLVPPKAFLNAPTKFMRDLGYGQGYVYDHDHPDGFSGQNCFPDAMARVRFYDPPERGFERDIRKRLAWWDRIRDERSRGSSED
nr:replication-associated recombination protein A [Phaeovibrio sulfidiphilus]